MSTKETNLSALTDAIGEKKSKEVTHIPMPPLPKKTNSVPDKVTQEALKNIKKENEEDERAQMFRRVNEYLRSPYLSPLLPKDIKPPSEKSTMAELKSIHASIKGALMGEAKRAFVFNIFDRVAEGGEFFLLNVLHDSSKLGLGNFVKGNREMFQPELEEIAIELNDNYIPGPQARLALKLMSIVQNFDSRRVFSKETQQDELEPK